MIDKNGII